MADQDRVEGAMKDKKGQLKETAGKAMGDSKLQSEGRMDRIGGKIQNALGSIKEVFRRK